MHINCTTITERPERFRHYCFWFVLQWIQKEIRRLIAGGFFSALSQKDVEVRLDLGYSIARNFVTKRQRKRIWNGGDKP